MTEQIWLEQYYRKNKEAVWIKLEMTDGTFQYFDHFQQWLEVKRLCDDTDIFIKKMAIQFRSHRVEIDIPSNCDGLYFIRSLKGAIGGTAKDHYTVGTVCNKIVHKLMFTVPELTIEDQRDETIENCFAEALIYAKKTTNGKK